MHSEIGGGRNGEQTENEWREGEGIRLKWVEGEGDPTEMSGRGKPTEVECLLSAH